MSIDLVRSAAQAASSICNVITTSFGPLGRDHLIVNTANQLKVTKNGKAIMDTLYPSKQSMPSNLRLLLTEMAALEAEAGDGTSTLAIMACAALHEVLDYTKSNRDCVYLAREFRQFRADAVIWESLVESTRSQCAKSYQQGQNLISKESLASVVASAICGQFPPRQERVLVQALVEWLTACTENTRALYEAIQHAVQEADTLIVPCAGQSPPRLLGTSSFMITRAPFYRIAAQSGSAQTQTLTQAQFTVWSCILSPVEFRENLTVQSSSTNTLEDALAYNSRRTHAFLERMHIDAGVNVIICTELLSKLALEACERLGILIVQGVNKKEARELCLLAGIDPIVDMGILYALDLSKTMRPFIGNASSASERNLGTSTCVLLEGITSRLEPKRHMIARPMARGQLLIFAPTLGLATEYKCALVRAVRLARLWLEHGFHDLTYRGGCWELTLSQLLLQHYQSRQYTSYSRVLSILHVAVRAVPLHLVRESARHVLKVAIGADYSQYQKYICLDLEDGSWSLSSSQSIGSRGEGSEFDVPLEPVILKIRQLERLVGFLEQILRIDAVITTA
mmetsp:Transcript_1253/g.3063  ORF Transcript_1253/g.3063 Transcript_1253/m.3063 type:complete len:568 (+) Transcript_1253:438-2141(+)